MSTKTFKTFLFSLVVLFFGLAISFVTPKGFQPVPFLLFLGLALVGNYFLKANNNGIATLGGPNVAVGWPAVLKSAQAFASAFLGEQTNLTHGVAGDGKVLIGLERIKQNKGLVYIRQGTGWPTGVTMTEQTMEPQNNFQQVTITGDTSTVAGTYTLEFIIQHGFAFQTVSGSITIL